MRCNSAAVTCAARPIALRGGGALRLGGLIPTRTVTTITTPMAGTG